MKNSNVNGFRVFVYQGREITESQAFTLRLSGKVVEKINGPHHSSKWAQHLNRKKPKPKFSNFVLGQPLTVNC